MQLDLDKNASDNQKISYLTDRIDRINQYAVIYTTFPTVKID